MAGERAELEIVITDNPQNKPPQQAPTDIPLAGEEPQTRTTVQPPPFPPRDPGLSGMFKDAAGAISANLYSMLSESAAKGKLPPQEKNTPIGKWLQEQMDKGLAPSPDQIRDQAGKLYGRSKPGDLFAEAPQAAKSIKDLAEAADKAKEGFSFWFKGRKFSGSVDPEEEVHKLLDMEKQREKLKLGFAAAYAKQEHEGRALFDAATGAEKKRQKNIDWFAQNFSGYPLDALPAKQLPEAQPVEDPRMAAMRRINSEQQRKDAQLAYNRMKFGQDTDPKQDKLNLGGQLTQSGMLAAMAGFPKLGTIAGSAGQMMSGMAMGGAAAAVGPVGLALAIDHAVKGAVRGAMDVTQRGAQRLGAIDANAFLDMEEDMWDFVGKFNTWGLVIGGAIKTARGFDRALEQTTKQLADLNPAIAFAEGQAEIRRTFGDIRRGQMLGGDLARLTDARSRIGEVGRDAMATVLKPVLAAFSRLLEKIANGVEALRPAIEKVDKGIDASRELGVAWYKNMEDAMKGIEEKTGINTQAAQKYYRWMQDFLQKQTDEGVPDDVAFPTLKMDAHRDALLPHQNVAKGGIQRVRDQRLLIQNKEGIPVVPGI